MTPKSTACCGNGVMWEGIYFVADKVKLKIAVVRQCVKCHRLLGDYVLIKPYTNKDLAAVQAKFNGTSWAMLLDVAVTRPGAPLHLQDGISGLVPEGYQGDLKEQPDLSHAAPDEPAADETEPPF